MVDRVVIAGAGQAGLQTAVSLRQLGFHGALTLIGDEAALPYQRPPLSKAYMLGKSSADALSLRPHQFFDDNNITLKTGTRITAIERAKNCLRLNDGSTIGYDHLVLALGARNRPLPIPGAEAKGVFGLRSLRDADAIAHRLEACRRIIVIGAGFIGLEFAAVASALGKNVDLFELSDRVMSRAVSRETSDFFGAAHRGWGVNLHLGKSIARINSDTDRVSSVQTTDGKTVPADLVLIGVGVIPNSDLALRAGLQVEDGIKVDADLLTSDPDVSAIGDCASFPLAGHDRHIRVESVQNAIDQGKTVAARLMGKPSPYKAVPWFWSDQNDLKLQIAGLSLGADRYQRIGDPRLRAMSVLCFARDRLVAVESVNQGSDHMAARRIFEQASGSLTFDEVSSAGFDLRSCLAVVTRNAAATRRVHF